MDSVAEHRSKLLKIGRPKVTVFKKTAVAILLAWVLQPALGRAAEGNPGDLLWESRGQSDHQGSAYAIAGEGGVVVATGEVGGNCSAYGANTCHWFVRAHDTHTGGTLWEDRPQTTDSFGRANSVAVSAGRVIAAGWMKAATGPSDLVVRAYKLNDGTLLWEKRVRRAAWTERAFAVVARDRRVYVAGVVASDVRREEFALLVLDAQTGDSLWESDVAGIPNPYNYAFARAGVVRAQGNQVFVAGSITSAAPSGISLLVQAHDAKTGAVRWEDAVPDAFLNLNANDFDDLAVGAKMLVVAGGVATSDPMFGSDYLLRAYDKQTGAMMWVDHLHTQAGGQASRLGFSGDRLFAYGCDCDETFFNCTGGVRAYDSQSGTLLWENRFTGPGGDSLIPTDAFRVHGGQVFVGAGLLDAQQDSYRWTVRSYDAHYGTLRWENQISDSGFQNAPVGLSAWGGRIYAVGTAQRVDGSGDFTVRAYCAGTDDDSSPEED